MKLVKIASGVSASVALLGAGGAASMPQAQVQAAVKYQIRVSKKAYVYTSKGKKTKKSYKKNAKVSAYGTKWIKGKKYYSLGKGRYIRTSNAKKVVPRYSYSTQSKKITRTIKMYQPKGVKKVIQNAYIKRTVKTNNKTKKKTYGAWSTSSWKKYKVAKVSGYTASRSSVGAAKVTYKRKNQMIKITYKVIKKTNKKKKTSKKTDTKPATKPSKPTNSGSSGSTGNSGSSSSSSSSSNNPGKGDAGSSNKPSNSGSSSPDSNKPSEKPSEPVKTAPADKVTTKEVPFKTVYQADSSMEAGTKKTVKNGENGIDTTTTKYNVDGSVKSTSTARTKEAVNEVIAVGTKTLVKTENLPYKTVNKDDSTLAKGTTKVVTKGVNGSRTTTTTYSLNTQTGEVTPTSSVKTVDPVDEVIAVGTAVAPAPKVSNETVAYKTVYRADSSMDAGTKKTIRAGVNGEDVTITIYNIDGSIKSTSTTHTKKAVDQIVAVGTKQTVKVETISYKTVKKDDSTLAKGTTKVITAGENGSRTTTTTYDLDTETGEVTANEQVTTVDPVDEVIAVGTREANPFNAEKTAELKQRLLAMINDYRAEVGASPLTMLDTYDSILDERAASKAKDLGTTGTWDHSGYDDLPEALTTVSDEELKAHGADDGYVHGGESIGANCFGLYDSTEDQINNYMHYEKMAENDEKADYQAIVIDKTRDYFTGPSQTCLHYLMMIDKKISKVYMGVGTYVDANGNAWLSAIFEFAL